LRTVLAAKKDLPKASAPQDGQTNTDKPGAENPPPADPGVSNTGADEPMAETADHAFGNEPGAAQVTEALQQFETGMESLPFQLRARTTLDAFNQLGRYLSALPGRKNLIWFSGSFPIDILPNGSLGSSFSADVSSADELRETADLLFRSQVAIYPADDRGSVETSLLKPKSPGSKYGRIPGAYTNDSSTFFEDTASEHSAMQALAEAIGGEANFNTQSLNEAVEEAFGRGSHYYTLTYAPTDQRQNGSYRKIRVEAARPGLTLEYRRGYFADDPNLPRRELEAEAPGEGQAPPYDPMRAAMMMGSPEPTEIILSASVRPATAGSEPGAAPGNTMVGTAKGPYRRYRVLFGVDASHVLCPADAGGAHLCTLQAAISVCDGGGTLVNSVASEVRSTLSSVDYAARSETDFRFALDISVPAQGDYFLRIGVQDETTKKAGAVELPVAAVSKLAPLSPQPTGTK
jgi:VWFA-related protein